jgi:hypothetical protein
MIFGLKCNLLVFKSEMAAQKTLNLIRADAIIGNVIFIFRSLFLIKQ